MNRSEVLRELYEALERLDAAQLRGARESVVDLRDVDGGVVVAGTLRHEVRTSLGADWDHTAPRW